jgi:hypothetical protein
MYVDLLGTCYDVLNKPMPLMQRHIDIYRHKVIMGIHNRVRRDKKGEYLDTMENEHDSKWESANLSSMDLEIN